MNRKSIPKISCYQLAAAVLVCRIFTLMTHTPMLNDGFTLAEQLTALAVSAAIAAAALIPSAVFFSKHGSAGIIDRINEKNRTGGIICAAVCTVYLLIACVIDISEFSEFIDVRFTADIPEWLTALLLTAACLYCAFCGAEGIARSAGAVILLFIIMAVSMLFGSADKADLENIRSGFSMKNAYTALTDDLARSTELAVLCLMGKFTRSGYSRGSYISVAARLLFAAGIVFSAVLVLGDYAYIGRYPFLDIGSAAGINFLQRIDSVYMIVWVLTAVLTIALKIYFAADILRITLPEGAPCGAVFSAAAYTLSMCGIYKGLSMYSETFMLSLLAAIIFVIPVTAIVSEKKGGYKIAEKRF